jgi:4-hydroxybenzoate polyprenyltransferase
LRPLSIAYRELVLGGHLLALGTASIAAAAALVFGKSPTLALLVMAYLFSFGAYMMNRSAEMDKDLASHPERTNYLAARRRILPAVVAASFLVGYVLAATVSWIFFLALLAPLALSLLYSVGSKRLVGLIGTTNLKQKLLLKNVSISLGWSLIPILVGFYFGAFDLPLLLLGPFIFLRLMTNTIVFDIRDAEGDRENAVRTLPTELGVPRSFQVVGAIDAASAAYLVLLLAIGLVPSYALTLMLLPIYSTIYRAFAIRSRANLGFICDFVADAEYALWGPLIYLGKILI